MLWAISYEMNKSTTIFNLSIQIFLLVGGFAQDCVQQGHPEFIATVLNTFETILNNHVANWIAKQGGWVRSLKCLLDPILFIKKGSENVCVGYI